jgi:hypothetical protein
LVLINPTISSKGPGNGFSSIGSYKGCPIQVVDIVDVGEESLEIFFRDMFVGACVFPRETSGFTSSFLLKKLGVDKVVFKGEICVVKIDRSKIFFFRSKSSPTHKLFS